jgi:maleate cis-trans isomerase
MRRGGQQLTPQWLAGVPMIEQKSFEARLRRPVLTANQVLFWRALRTVGMTSKVRNYGAVFAKDGPAG